MKAESAKINKSIFYQFPIVLYISYVRLTMSLDDCIEILQNKCKLINVGVHDKKESTGKLKQESFRVTKFREPELLWDLAEV